MPLINKDSKKAIVIATEVLNKFPDLYKKKWLTMMRKKLGIAGEETVAKKATVVVNEVLNTAIIVLSIVFFNKCWFFSKSMRYSNWIT